MVPEVHADERRLHPFSWLFVLITQLREVALPAIVLLVFGRGQWWEFVAMVGALALALYSLIYSFGFRYRIATSELVVREGIFDRTERHIPFARIQNIARRSNLLHRLFQVTELRLESGGGLKPEAVMKVLPVRDADALVALLRARRGADEVDVVAGQPPASTSAVEPLLQLPLPELVRLGLISNRGMVVVAGAFAAFWQFDPTSGKAAFRPLFNFAEQIVGEVEAMHPSVLSMVVAGAAVLLLLFAALRLLSVVLAVLMHYDFRLERDGDRLGAGGGLLTHAHGSARVDRLQMLYVQETLLHRLFGRMSLKTDVAGGVRAYNDESGKLHWLAPIATPAQVDGLIASILQVTPLSALPWRALHARAWRRRARWPMALSLLLAAGLMAWFGAPGVLALLLVAWFAQSARGWAAFTRYALDDRVLAFRSGWWSRQYALIELDKLQVVELLQSPFDRRSGMATVRIDSMSTDGLGAGIRIPYLPVAEARALFAILSRRAAEVR